MEKKNNTVSELQRLINNKVANIDCTEEESAFIKMFFKENVKTDLSLLETIELLAELSYRFPIEYGEACIEAGFGEEDFPWMKSRKEKMSKRTFYKTVIQITVLSEEPYTGQHLETIAFDISNGECSGEVGDVVRNQKIDALTAVQLLKDQSSDPEFFRLTETGEDVEEE